MAHTSCLASATEAALGEVRLLSLPFNVASSAMTTADSWRHKRVHSGSLIAQRTRPQLSCYKHTGSSRVRITLLTFRPFRESAPDARGLLHFRTLPIEIAG